MKTKKHNLHHLPCMRKPRILLEGAWYHIIARINRSEKIFDNNGIKNMFLSVVKKAREKRNPFRFEIANFCIMGNHIHFLIRPAPGNSLSRIMQWILSVFAMRYNRFMKISGHVWYDRFKSIIVNGIRAFLAVSEYIDQNPVKAGLCLHPEDYEFCGAWHRERGLYTFLDKDIRV
ncbi:MAG: transposase [Spirochaetaceae bacterium]|nr:transposase [Spirochaetaceae bacterium]